MLKSAHGTGDVSRNLLSTMFAHKQLCKEVHMIEDETVKEFTLDMLCTGRRIKSLKSCENCQIAGKSTPLNDETITQKVADVLKSPAGILVLKKHPECASKMDSW